jgi:hypothetical protein
MRKLRAISYKLIQILWAVTLLPGSVAAAGRSVIRGSVTIPGPDGSPVYAAGVQVVLRCPNAAETARTTFTDQSGRFSFVGLAPDKCRATATMEGFRSETKKVVVPGKSTVDLSFQLEFETVAERRRKP